MSTPIRYLFAALVLTGSLACSGTEMGASSDPARFNSPSTALGKQALTERGCAACHGGDLSGLAKPITAMMMFVDKANDSAACPANLTPDATGLADWDEAAIVRALLTGKDDENEDLNEAMPRYGTMKMADGEARSIAMYLKSLSPVKKSLDDAPACKAN
jgi:cytochrome c